MDLEFCMIMGYKFTEDYGKKQSLKEEENLEQKTGHMKVNLKKVE
jgi:hypothetical protein